MCLSSSTIWGYWHHAAIWQIISSKCHTGMSTTFKYSNPPGYQLHIWWRCSDPPNSMENLADLWVTVWKVYWVCKKRNMTNQSSVWWLPRWSFYRRQFPSEMEEIIFLLERGNLGTLLRRAFLSVKGNQWKYIFCWVMEWWHQLGLIRSLLKSIWWRQSTAAAGLTVTPGTATEKK